MTRTPAGQAETAAPAEQVGPPIPSGAEPEGQEPPARGTGVPHRLTLPGWPFLAAAELAVSGTCALAAAGMAWVLLAAPAVVAAERARRRRNQKAARGERHRPTGGTRPRHATTAAARRQAARALRGLRGFLKPARSTGRGKSGTGRGTRRRRHGTGTGHRSAVGFHGSTGPRRRSATARRAGKAARTAGRALARSWDRLWPVLAAALAGLLALLRLLAVAFGGSCRQAARLWHRTRPDPAESEAPPADRVRGEEEDHGDDGTDIPAPRVRPAGRPLAVPPRTPQPAPTSTGSTHMSAIVEKSQELRDLAAAFDPETIREVRAYLADWKTVLANTAAGLAAVREKEWPIHSTIKDHAGSVSEVLLLAREGVAELLGQFDVIHQVELANIDRVRQEMWDAERNRS